MATTMYFGLRQKKSRKLFNLKKHITMKQHLFNYLRDFELILTDEQLDGIIRICKQIIAERTTSDTKLYLLYEHLSEEYYRYFLNNRLAEIVSICERIE